MTKSVIILFLLFSSSCTIMTSQVQGWPQDLKITTHRLGPIEIQKRCYRYIPWYWKIAGSVAMECTEINLDTRECNIYTFFGHPSEHEIDHCKGWDHDGILQDYYLSWLKLHPAKMIKE